MNRTAVMLLVILARTGSVHAQVDQRAAIFAVERAASETAWNSGIAAALNSVLADSAVLLWPGAPILRGKAGIGHFFGGQPATFPGTRFMWQPMHVEVSANSNLALVWGVMVADRLGGAGGTGDLHRIGRYMAIWRRDTGAEWRMQIFAPIGVVAASETVWDDSFGPPELPELLRTRPAPSGGLPAARIFAAADSAFAADALRDRAAAAFGKWAAPDAVSFAGNGELNVGPAMIQAAIAGLGDAEWRWAPVAAGMDQSGIGYTLGQATIIRRDAAGKEDVSKSKYLTFWRRAADNTIHFIADGGNGRP